MKVSDLISILTELGQFLRETADGIALLNGKLEQWRDETLPIEIFQGKSPPSSQKATQTDEAKVILAESNLKALQARCIARELEFTQIRAQVKSALKGLKAPDKVAVAKRIQAIPKKDSGTAAEQAIYDRFEQIRSGADETRAIQESFSN